MNTSTGSLIKSKYYCANVLTPIYVLIGKKITGEWNKHSEAIICISNIEYTDELVDSIGGLEVLTKELNKIYGSDVFDTPETWDKFLVSEEIIKVLYSKVLSYSNVHQVLGLMSRVTPHQRFGVPYDVPMKAGWGLQKVGTDWSLVTHIVSIHNNLIVAKTITKELNISEVVNWYSTLREDSVHLIRYHTSLSI